MAGKYGIPYFQNFVNSDLDPSAVRSMCCRLQLDLTELTRRGGGLFGANEFTGSIGVVTINLPRIGYLCDTEDEFLQRLDKLMEVAYHSLEIKREVINNLNNLNDGKDTLFPYTKRYLSMGWKNHFSTIGIVGMNEACQNLFGEVHDLLEDDCVEFAASVLRHMQDRLKEFQQRSGNLYNLEASPAEGTSYRLAKHDKKRYDDIITAGTEDNPYYTNSTHLPVNATDDLFEALELQEPLQTAYTGGTVLHAYLGERIGSEEAKIIVRKAFENFRLPYLSLTPTFSVCPNHGYIIGENWECPECGGECEVFSRVTGYYRPVERFNVGKKQEYKDRKVYKGRQ